MTELRQRVQPDVTPALDEAEVLECLERAAYGVVWTASTATVYGQCVFPTTDAGYWYRCTTGGTTDTTEPDWPDRERATVEDGTAVWQCAGTAPRELWNIRLAEHYCWAKRCAKSASMVNASSGRVKSECEAVYLHCLAQAAMTRPLEIA